ncbi:MAG: LacI family DNA-binding transcriptional regulator [Clostridia bacterium]|nr:LacI family DNA-binding transcriptional regulator [Clostridia bacterium]
MKIDTIRDIAERAGVSVTTVSRVLNNRPDVSRATQEKVRRVMKESHFVGNANARGLKRADQEMVAVIVRGRQNPFLSALAEEMLQCAAPGKAPFALEYIDEQADEFHHALMLTHSRRASGLIFLGSRIDDRCHAIDGVNLPMVFATVTTQGTPMARASSVSMDDRAMACQAIEALLQRGHEKIAVFGGDRQGTDSLALRALGVEDAFHHRGMQLEEGRYVETRFTLSDAYEAALSFFRRCPDTDAAFCMSDTVALGVIRALVDLGRRVPQDVSVLGIDGIEMGRYSLPRLSTVAQPIGKIARESVAVLTEMMESGAHARHVTVPASLVLRESVREA